MRIAERDEPKTIYAIRYDSYEFLIMPFELTNATVNFCNLINDVFYAYLNDLCVRYIDDIVIYS